MLYSVIGNYSLLLGLFFGLVLFYFSAKNFRNSKLSDNIIIKGQEILDKINALNYHIQEETYAKIFNDIDYYAFQEELNIDRCLQVVRWTVDKISMDWQILQNQSNKAPDFESLKENITHYLELFRDSFYR